MRDSGGLGLPGEAVVGLLGLLQRRHGLHKARVAVLAHLIGLGRIHDPAKQRFSRSVSEEREVRTPLPQARLRRHLRRSRR